MSFGTVGGNEPKLETNQILWHSLPPPSKSAPTCDGDSEGDKDGYGCHPDKCQNEAFVVVVVDVPIGSNIGTTMDAAAILA